MANKQLITKAERRILKEAQKILRRIGEKRNLLDEAADEIVYSLNRGTLGEVMSELDEFDSDFERDAGDILEFHNLPAGYCPVIKLDFN